MKKILSENWGTVILLIMVSFLFRKDGVFDFWGFAVWLGMGIICIILATAALGVIDRREKRRNRDH